MTHTELGGQFTQRARFQPCVEWLPLARLKAFATGVFERPRGSTHQRDAVAAMAAIECVLTLERRARMADSRTMTDGAKAIPEAPLAEKERYRTP